MFRPVGVFSGKKYNLNPVSKHCSFLSFHTIRNSAKHAIGESDHGLTGIQSPNANINGFRCLKNIIFLLQFLAKLFGFL